MMKSTLLLQLIGLISAQQELNIEPTDDQEFQITCEKVKIQNAVTNQLLTLNYDQNDKSQCSVSLTQGGPNSIFQVSRYEKDED